MVHDWEALASREPWYTTIPEPRFLRSRLDGIAESDLYATGEAAVGELYATVRSRLKPRFNPSTILEIGCGVGRLAIPFARRAESVTGVDVSRTMLALADARARKENISLELLTPAELSKQPRTWELVSCLHILHHLRRDDGLALLKDAAARVARGGIGVFEVPIRSRASPLIRLSRNVRASVPGVNALANAIRRKPLGVPFFRATIYDLGAVLSLLQEIGFSDPSLSLKTDGDVDVATLYLLRQALPAAVAEPVAPKPEPRRDARHIDVRTLIGSAPIEEHNLRAERYFSSLAEWQDHLAKPFGHVEDAPQLLINLAVVLQGLSLAPGMTVLEYGAGTGWLSHGLTQLGCRAILLDVSPTALDIARELYRAHPPFGERPEPEFLVFNGRRIDLPDASVDRIICFDAFHHAPNPDEVLREFGRVLRPGGIAGFAEPGPHHSFTAQSQYEMRTHGVIENDIDLDSIDMVAKSAGFSRLSLAALNVPPFIVSAEEHADLLAGGETLARWGAATRDHMNDTRLFFLEKEGPKVFDSRRAEGLHATVVVTKAGTPRAGEPVTIRASVRNSGRADWLPSGATPGGVSLGCHLYDAEGTLLNLDYAWIPLPHALKPGESVEVDGTLPPLEAGRYLVELDCVANRVTWFAQTGSTPARLTIDVG